MNRVKVYCVYDSKAENYGTPFMYDNRALALRAFSEVLTQPDHPMSKYPADFTLFEVGEWDKTDGIMIMLEAKINLGTALEYVTRANNGTHPVKIDN